MHILELPSFFTPYGGEFCLEQARALKKKGHTVRILSVVQLSIRISGYKQYLTLPYFTQHFTRDGVDISQRFTRGIPLIIRPNVNNWISTVKKEFYKYIKQYGKPDIIHAHCAKWAGYAAMLIKKEYGIPYVITEHLSKLLYEKEFNKCGGMQAWQIPMIKEAYQVADMNIPVAEELVRDTAIYFGTNYNYMPISNIQDTEFYKYKKRTNGNFTFCCLAIFDYLKGYDILLPAFDKVADIYKECQLHIAGRGTDSKSFNELVRRCRNRNNIHIHGLLNGKEKIRALLYDCNALVLASRSEVQPLVLLEAMGTGIPVIATEITPKSERIVPGCTIVPIDDIDALTKAMIETMHTPIDGKSLSEEIKNRFSADVIAEQLHQLFQRIYQHTNLAK